MFDTNTTEYQAGPVNAAIDPSSGVITVTRDKVGAATLKVQVQTGDDFVYSNPFTVTVDCLA